jgi:hypothetical protein
LVLLLERVFIKQKELSKEESSKELYLILSKKNKIVKLLLN